MGASSAARGTVEFGIFAGLHTREGRTQAETFDEWLGLAQLAEDIGIDCFWLAEFHFRPRTILSAPLVLAAAIAARTQRMKIGIAVSLLPLANPVHLAEEAATVDHISKGRLILGVGRSSFLDAYQGYNVSYRESRRRFFECLEILTKAWGDEPFSYKGEFNAFHNVNVVPKPYQRPHPAVRVACESRESFAMLGEFGFPILIRHQMPIPELRGLVDQYRDAGTAAGHDVENSVTLQVPVYVAGSSQEARQHTEVGVQRDRELLIETARTTGDKEAYERLSSRPVSYDDLLQRPGLGAFPNPLVFGTAEEVGDRIEEYQEDLGVTGISMTLNPGNIPSERIVSSLRLLAEKVIPRFR
jgi:alkanesulfonate monooxygenase SsuD/methylene tetrahydromethanopterin reductase-like flavin-dependent oxidoreductase (luciferase family)